MTTDILSLDVLDPNPWQPRAQLNPERVAELAEDINQNGLLQRPLVRPSADGRYQIVFGHYRVAAIRLLIEQGRWPSGLIPVEVRDLMDAEAALLALAENTKREDLTPIEQYRAWQHALETIPGLQIQHIAAGVGLDRSTVSNNLRLLRLPPFVLERVANGELSAHAAREFLCLMGPDHCHEEDMAVVVNTIAAGHSGAPDWRVAHVRQRIRRQVTVGNEPAWRPLEPKDQDAFAAEGGGAWREPSFDIDVFAQDHPNELHGIPKYEGDTARVWTCNVREWQRRQTQATRAKNQQAAASTPSSAPAATPAKSPKSADLTRTLARDALAQAITRPTGVSQETRKPAQIERDLAKLNDAQKTALGSRANATIIDAKTFHALLDAAEHYQARLRAPSYFDRDECLNRCTNGATYGHFDAKQPLALYCLNEQCYAGKLAQSQQAVEQRLAHEVAAEDAEDKTLVEQVRARLDPALSLPLMAVMVALKPYQNTRTLDGLPYGEREKFKVTRATTQRIQELTGIDLIDRRWGPEEEDHAKRIIGMMAEASPEVQLELASCLVVYAIRDNLADGVGYLLGKL